MNALGIVAPRRLSMMAFGIATTSALTSLVPAGHGGGVGVACGVAGDVGVAGATSVFAAVVSTVFVSVGSEVFGIVAVVFAGDSEGRALASAIGLSFATFGVCARAVVPANKVSPSIVNEATTGRGDLKPSMSKSPFSTHLTGGHK